MNIHQSNLLFKNKHPVESHWSGGLYSQEFTSYDKWGDNNYHLYGPPTGSLNTYESPSIFQSPIMINNDNYELLVQNEKGPAKGIESFDNNMNITKKRIVDVYQLTILQIVFIVMLFIFDKSFGSYVENSPLWIKMMIMLCLAVLTYYILTQDNIYVEV